MTYLRLYVPNEPPPTGHHHAHAIRRSNGNRVQYPSGTRQQHDVRKYDKFSLHTVHIGSNSNDVSEAYPSARICCLRRRRRRQVIVTR